MPTKPIYNIPQSSGVVLIVVEPVTIGNIPEILIYNAGGGQLFPDLPNDLVLEPGIYHGGNPLLIEEFSILSNDSLNINVETKDVYSPEQNRGLFDVEYPIVTGSDVVDGKIKYFWNDVFTTPLGLYTHQGSVSGFNFNANLETITIQSNDVNVIFRTGDFIVFNKVPINFSGYNNSIMPKKLPYFKGTEIFQARIIDVIISSGVGINTIYQLQLDKSYAFNNGDNYSISLLNRTNTSIQKELFYKTFEQIEIHKKQLLGDPYNNQNDTNKPIGRVNHLYYKGSEGLGYQNMFDSLIGNQDTPFIVFDANDEIKDRIAFKKNVYNDNNKPFDIYFEFHLPTVMINDNLVSGIGSTSPVDANGNISENIFITQGENMSITGIGNYGGLYLKNDLLKTRRYGFVLYDLRVVIIDDSELVTALGYNSNRNYTLPAPVFQNGSGNAQVNSGTNIKLDISDASNSLPIIITVSKPFNLPRGTVVLINGVKGNTNANGVWYLDTIPGSTDLYKFELWQQMPTYFNGSRISGSGVPLNGNGVFVNDGLGASGNVYGALPNYSFFYTYRVRNEMNNSTMPYSKIQNFNFTLSGNVDNNQGSLLVNIPPMLWYDQQNNLLPYDLGFSLIPQLKDIGFGIDIIIGEYETDLTNLIDPSKIIGIKNLMCIPLKELTLTPIGDPTVGMSIEIKKIQDFDRVVNATLNHIHDYTFDLKDVQPLYNYNTQNMSTTLLTGAGQWTLGNIINRNHVKINRAKFNITVGAEKWNASSNPSYKPSENKFITDKYISEVAILQKPDINGNIDYTPLIYAKIAPAIKKSQDLDIVIQLSIDY